MSDKKPQDDIPEPWQETDKSLLELWEEYTGGEFGRLLEQVQAMTDGPFGRVLLLQQLDVLIRKLDKPTQVIVEISGGNYQCCHYIGSANVVCHILDWDNYRDLEGQVSFSPKPLDDVQRREFEDLRSLADFIDCSRDGRDYRQG